LVSPVLRDTVAKLSRRVFGRDRDPLTPIAAQGKTAAQTSERSGLEPKLALVNGRRIRTTSN
jgi:hypothetical protein